MRIDSLNTSGIPGYEDFESVAKTFKPQIQEQINATLADGRDSAMSLENADESVRAYYRHLLLYVRPTPNEHDKRLVEKSLMFGAYLGSLLARPHPAILETTTFQEIDSVEEREIYVNAASWTYLAIRQHIDALITRNLLVPVPDGRDTRLIRTIAGLAVMQSEEYHFNSFLKEQDAKLADDLTLNFGGVLPDDWEQA